jgi:hypothetical protein
MEVIRRPARGRWHRDEDDFMPLDPPGIYIYKYDFSHLKPVTEKDYMEIFREALSTSRGCNSGSN